MVERSFSITTFIDHDEDGNEVTVYNARSDGIFNHRGIDCNANTGAGYNDFEAIADWAGQAARSAIEKVEKIRRELEEAETNLLYWHLEHERYQKDPANG